MPTLYLNKYEPLQILPTAVRMTLYGYKIWNKIKSLVRAEETIQLKGVIWSGYVENEPQSNSIQPTMQTRLDDRTVQRAWKQVVQTNRAEFEKHVSRFNEIM